MLSDSEIAEIIDRVKGRVQAAEGRARTGPSLAAADAQSVGSVDQIGRAARRDRV